MAKPIFIINVPVGIGQAITKDIETAAAKKLGEEYHVLVVSTTGSNITFEAFYEKNFNQVKYEELKEIVQRKADEVEEIKKDCVHGHTFAYNCNQVGKCEKCS